MNRLQIATLMTALSIASPAAPQTLDPQMEQSLAAQGFEVTSIRYTWLGRVLVEVTNGKVERNIMISRGSNQILQDNWRSLDLSQENMDADSDIHERPPAEQKATESPTHARASEDKDGPDRKSNVGEKFEKRP